ncbi:hypothetical protein F1559_000741 [Cyanidiococcus yangmingshanensis]|uniref:Auxin efflux carrier n=1 Tax=Cyanidiococcus yangmingshanensis TaxID=2690220 RepID=A0A7J7IJB9_9RHOD|nr:hypothetical protein F1559_000741 [Cyanidiococcus yangmingshanensis]
MRTSVLRMETKTKTNPNMALNLSTPQVNHRSVVVKNSAGENNALLQSSMLLLAARRIEPVLHALGTPPAFASILGLLVGLFRPLRSLLYANDQILSLGLLRTLKTLAAANGACALLVLAASLANKTPNDRDRRFKNSMESDSSSVSNRSGRESHRVVAIVLSLHHRVWRLLRSADLSLLVPILITRCVLLPLVSLTIVFPVANRFDLLPHGLTGQLVRFVVLLQGSMPPAQNIVVGLQLDGNHNEAAYAGRQLLVAYLISLVPLSILLTFFLGILNI